MTAKRILTGVLTAAMVVTSVNLPGMATSVQAATVYDNTTTALSELSGSTGLKIYRLTSADAGKELESGIYYVDEDLTFTGVDSTSSSQAGGNGLKIADGATVYIYIAEGKTLTATGGKGYAGTDGANGTQGKVTVTNGKGTHNGITYPEITSYENGKGGAGGSGATGGGAAIYVPTGSQIAILGNGSLNATGGTGGNAGNGQNGEKTKYYYFSYGAEKTNGILGYKTTNNISFTLSSSSVSGTSTTARNTGTQWVVIGGAGGSGGGGAAGGGAGIGTNGADGNVGATGVTGSIDYSENDDDDGSIDKVTGNSATTNKSVGLSGQVYIGNVTVNATGGAGGQAGNQQAVVTKHQHSITYYDIDTVNKVITTNSGTFWVQDGQSGGGGGAGGTGASIGTGGVGGAGGAGGDSGSCYAKHDYANETGYASESVRGANGNAGTTGTGSASTLGDTQYPYNNITFTNLTSANRKYYLTKSDTFTAPGYSVSENQIFVGWKVTTPAVALPEAFGETADTQLTTADTIIPAGTEVSTAGIYGNITLEPYVVNHTHNWTYETDSTDSSKVYAWCVGEENADACPYSGEEKKLTLSLDAEGKTYDGTAYNGATVEDKITSVTKATAGSVTYYEADSDGNKTGSAISAPVNAGKYVAEVTVSDGNKSASATKAFEIKRADQTANVSMSGYEYGKTVSTPDVSGAKENPSVTYYYSTKNENKDGTEWKDIKNDTLDPGTYYMYAVLAQTDNYNTYTTAPVSFTVQGSDMSGVTAADVTKTYDGSSYGITVNTGSIPNATVTYGTEAGTYDLTECPAYKNVGTYTIYYKVDARGYNSFTGSATVTITKKAVTATVTAKDKTYDGNTNATVSAEVSSDDLISGDSITINGITGTFDDKNAGTDKKVTVDSSKAEFTGTGVDNYAITIGTEATASIDKLTAEFNWSNTDLTYTGNEQSVTAEVKNAVSGDKFTLTYDGNKQTAVGDYIAKVTALGNDNYKLPEAGKAQTAWKISYLAKGTAEVSGTKGDNDWYVTKVTITPETGYEISANGTDWAASLEYDAQGSQTAEYYLKETATGFISDKNTAEFKIDTGLPTGEIKIKDNGFTGFLNTITFKHFFKKTVDVTITGTDAISGIAKIEYQNVAKGASFDKDGTWETGKSFSMAANDKSAVYAKITDNAGNFVIINSDGFVVYTDATAAATERFVRTSEDDIATGIAVNGNTIASVMIESTDDKDAAAELVSASGYKIEDGRLVLRASYLQTLAVGTYTLTVSYNPYGEAYTADSEGEAPDVSVITLAVIGEMKVFAEGYAGTYDGQAYGITVNVTEPADTAASNVKVVYGTEDADGNIIYSGNVVTYKNAGEYTVYYKVTADNYEDFTGSEVIKIEPKTVSLVWSDTEFTYDGKAHKPSAKVNEEDIIGTDKVEVTVSGEQTDANTDKTSDYTAQAVALDNGNYALPELLADVTATFMIKPAKAVVTVDNAIKHVGKADPSFTYKVTGLVSGENLEDISFTRAEGETTGDYEIIANEKEGSNANYDVTFVAGKLTITDHVKAEAPVVENRMEAACTEDGSYDEVYYCTVEDCKAELERVHQTIPALGHKYGEPEFTWSEDYSKAEAAFTCANDKTHVETVEAKVTTQTVAAACETAGKNTYTATAEFEGKTYSEVKEAELPAAGHDWSEWVKVGNREKSSCLRCGQVRYRNIETADTGSFEKDAEIAPGSPIAEATLDNDKSQLIVAGGIFTAEEKALIEAGSDARVWLEIAKTDEADISAEDKSAVIKEAEKIMGENPDILFFDANLFKQVAAGDKTQLHEPGMAIKITIQVPSELLNHDRSMVREYKIIRLHDGETDVLGGSFNEATNEFTFETDKFSTYAIAYADRPVNNGGSDDKPGDITEPDNKPDDKDTGDKNTNDDTGSENEGYIVSPSTGGTTGYSMQWMLLAVVLMAGVILISAGRKKNSRQ